jgi:HPt (histidine-containing phosphotransfer) domain-containing protein
MSTAHDRPAPGSKAESESGIVPILPLDESALDRLREVSEELVGEVAEYYCTTMPEQLDAMALAVVRGDVEQVHHAAHNAKSNSATVGATRLAQTFEAIERRAGAGSLDGVLTLMDEARALVPAVCAVLRRHLPGGGAR